MPRPSDDRFSNQLVAELDRLLCLSFVLPVEEDRQNCQAVYADRSFVPSLIPLVVYSVPFSNVRFNQREIMQESRLTVRTPLFPTSFDLVSGRTRIVELIDSFQVPDLDVDLFRVVNDGVARRLSQSTGFHH